MKVFSSLTIEAEIWLLVNDRVQDLTWLKVGKIELKSVKQWVHSCVGHKSQVDPTMPEMKAEE